MSVSERKKQLRRVIKERKISITQDFIREASAVIFNAIEQKKVFKQAEVIMAYWSMPGEVNTHDFIQKWYRQRTILLPVIQGELLTCKKFTGFEMLKREDKLGIFEPSGPDYKEWGEINLVIVPGVAFDRKNNRLGRGKAYYDKFLQVINAYKIGVCFDFQLVDEVPSEDSDIKMDEVITNLSEIV